MQYLILAKAKTNEVEIVGVEDSKNLFSEMCRLINASLTEVVKSPRLKSLTEDEDTKEFMCMLVDDEGRLKENQEINDLGTVLYGGGIIVGDIILCKFKFDPFGDCIKAFSSEEEAVEWLHKIEL